MRLFICVLAALIFSSCNSGDNGAELIRLQNENDSLKAWISEQDSVMSSINLANSDIDSNLSAISRKKEAIQLLAKKGKLTKKDRQYIMEQMDSINILLALNKERVKELDSTLSNNKTNVVCAKQMVQSMTEKNVSQDVKLTDMKRDLAQVSRDFSDLFQEFVYKEAENMEMREQLSSAEELLQNAKDKLNSAWYVIGTKDALKEKGIVYKSGLFDSKSVNEDFDKSMFRKIDIHQMREIMLDTKKADIMTTHPTGSYELIGIKKKVNKLVIRDPEQFWSVSKFLIIETE